MRSNIKNILKDDNKLLKKLIFDQNQAADLYKPSEYWIKKNYQSYLEILEKGINNFRGNDNNIGESFSDNQNIDILNDYYGGFRYFIRSFFKKIFPFKNIYTRQIALTSSFNEEKNLYKSNFFQNNHHIKKLYRNYSYKNTVNCGCKDFSIINNNRISNYYFLISNTHHNFKKQNKFKKLNSYFEIGGGFGANIHFLLQNYKNLKKIIYLDLPINLYIATQYLKYFFGNSVFDYNKVSNKKISFKKDNSLEIFCIPPWKIEDIVSNIDIFQNSNSFVEMDQRIVKNYSIYIEKILKKDSLILISSYEKVKNNKTIDPNKLPKFFKRKFKKKKIVSIIPDKFDYYFISE